MSLTIRQRRKLELIIPRFLTDLVVIVASLMLAFSIRFSVAYHAPLSLAEQEPLIETTLNLFWLNLPVVLLVTMGIFIAFGFYTRTRLYKKRYKAIVVTQATVVAALGYVMVTYLIQPQAFLPRSVLIMTFGFILAGCGGARWLKARLERHYVVRPREIDVQLNRQPGPKRILLIGGAGYLGSVLCRQLLDKGYRVRVLDLLMFGDGGIRAHFDNPYFEFMHGDFRHVGQVVRATRDVHAVVHLGAIVGDPACAVDEDYSTEVNYAATQMISEICRGAGIRRFVFASTCSVYGAADELLDEHSALNPVSLYAKTKIDSESALLAMHDSDFSPTVLRFATVFGLSPRPRFDLVVNIVTAMAIKDGRCVINGGSQWRPFIHTTDVARGIITVLEAPEGIVAGETFNLGDDRLNMQLSEIGDLVEKVIPEARVIRQEENVDRRNYRVSFKKIHSCLGFSCKVDVEAGMKEIRDAIRSGLVTDFRASKYSNLSYIKRLRESGRPEVQSAVNGSRGDIVHLPLVKLTPTTTKAS